MNPALLEKLEDLPAYEKVSPGFQGNKRIHNPYCACCGGEEGIRAAKRKPDNSKPKYKKHHVTRLYEARK